MYRLNSCLPSLGLLAGALVAPAAAIQAHTEVLPKDRAAKAQGERPHSTEARSPETPADGEFFMEPRAPMGAALPDSVVQPPVESISISRDRLYFQSDDASTWVRGRTYKAEATASGLTYIPFLGSDAPRNYPVKFRLESATLGNREIVLAESASVSQSNDRVVLDRGPVDVIYDFSVESVEQSFSLDVAGATSDLTLSLEVTTELGVAPHGGAFSFSNELGGMRYGEAIVLDGAGRQASVAAHLDGSRLILTVPAAFLATATGQIIVDPIFTTFSVDTASGFQRDVEICYSVGQDRFLYVYEDQFSGTDVDVYATDIRSDGTLARGDYMDFSSEDWTDPSAATVTLASKGLVAATSHSGASTGIVGRTWDFLLGSFDAGTIAISPVSSTITRSTPDVGGSWSGTAGARFLVVWTADYGPDSDAQGRLVFPDGTLGSSLFLDSSTASDATDVCVSESMGDPTTVNRWNVAWIDRRLSDNEYSIEVTQLNAAGALAFPAFPVVTLPVGASVGELDVSDAIRFAGVTNPVYTIAYDEYSTVEADTFILFVEGGAVLGSAELQVSEHADLTLDQAEARLSTTPEEFVVSYLEQDPAGGVYHGFITAFDFTEGRFLSISERRVPLGAIGAAAGTNYNFGGGLCLASRYSGGFTTSRYIGVGHEVGNGTASDVAGLVYFASNGYSPAFQYCYGNPNSTGDRGFIRLDGDRSTTNGKNMIATALPPNSFGYFIVGRAFANVPNPGGSAGVLCVGGTIGRYSNFVTSSGSTGTISVTFNPQQIAQPNGAVTGMSGQFWQFSLWHRDSAGGVATSNFTNAVSILFE